MPLRYFTCGACGHRMRVLGRACGRCSTRKPVHKTTTAFVVSVAATCASAALAAMVLLP